MGRHLLPNNKGTFVYYVTCETNSPIIAFGEIHRTLPPTRILYTYCCKPAEEGGWLSEKYVVKIPHGIFTRREILETEGVVRVRTFDGASNLVTRQIC